MAPFLKNVSFASVSLDVVMDQAKPLMRSIMNGIYDMITSSDSIIAPQPIQVYSCAHLEEAFQFMSSGNSAGKIVLDFSLRNFILLSSSA